MKRNALRHWLVCGLSIGFAGCAGYPKVEPGRLAQRDHASNATTPNRQTSNRQTSPAAYAQVTHRTDPNRSVTAADQTLVYDPGMVSELPPPSNSHGYRSRFAVAADGQFAPPSMTPPATISTLPQLPSPQLPSHPFAQPSPTTSPVPPAPQLHAAPQSLVGPQIRVAPRTAPQEMAMPPHLIAAMKRNTLQGTTGAEAEATLLPPPVPAPIPQAPIPQAPIPQAPIPQAPMPEPEVPAAVGSGFVPQAVAGPVSSHSQPIADRNAVASNALQLNLPTALSMVGGQHPAVGMAQWRVQEAYARLASARVMWLPSIRSGFSFHRHDGNYQASNGDIVDVNRNSFQYGLGNGATGAGTTPRPGVAAEFHLADAIFQPKVAKKTAWARGHAANGVVNLQLLNVAVAYLELMDAEQDKQIVQETRNRTSELSKLTADFAAAGQGLQADADRLKTELGLVENRLISGMERVEVAGARLSQALSIDAGQTIVPLDPTVVPIELVSADVDKGTLIGTGLANRPELKEAQALVDAACAQYKRQKYAPFVPSVLLGFSTGGFGGGLGNNLDNVDNRYDFDALMTWEVRNLGFGEKAARRESDARVQRSRFEKLNVLDQVAREVSEAHAQVVHRSQRIMITQSVIESAEASYQRNLSRIRDGQGLPLEVLQSVQALEDARRAYLTAVVDYNEAQFRLQWALGWPINGADVTH